MDEMVFVRGNAGPSQSRLPTVETALASSFAQTEGEAYEPEHEEDQRNDPKEMRSEAEAGEDEYEEKCEQQEHPRQKGRPFVQNMVQARPV